MFGDQLWASALALASKSTSAGVTDVSSGSVRGSAGVSRGTVSVSAPVIRRATKLRTQISHLGPAHYIAPN